MNPLFRMNFIFIFLCLSLGLISVTGLTPRQKSELNKQINSLRKCANLDGVSLALVGTNRETGLPQTYTKAFGFLDPDTEDPATPDSIFCIGECTRGFTSTLLAMLLAENKNYTWDTPLWDILGDWIRITDWYRTRNVNLKDILTMRTGIGGLKAAVTHDTLGKLEFLGRFEYVKEVFSYRDRYVEHDGLFTWLERVVGALTDSENATWETEVEKRIFQPLKMNRCTFVHEAEEKSGIALPTVQLNGSDSERRKIPFESFRGKRLVAASSSICLSANDMAKWMTFQLGDGRTGSGERLLRFRDLLETHRYWTVRSDPGNPFVEGFSQPGVSVAYTFDSYGLGWVRGLYRGYQTIVHGGSLPGYETQMTLIPTRKVGVYTSFTGASGSKALAAKTVINLIALDILLQGFTWITEPCQQYYKHEKIASQISSKRENISFVEDMDRDVVEYTGEYENPALYKLEVKYNETTERLSLHYGELGDYTLHKTPTNGEFAAEATGSLFYITGSQRTLPRVYFSSKQGYGGEIDTVTIPFFDPDVIPVFEKYLKYPRNFLLATCDRSSVLTSNHYVVFVLLALCFIPNF